VFERIAALLLALAVLAVLADRAACRSRPVRGLVLWLLRPAEATARVFAIEAGYAPFVLAGSADIRSSHDEAARLAREFRALAAVFHVLSARALDWRRDARRPDPARHRPNAARAARPLLFAAFRRCYADTS